MRNWRDSLPPWALPIMIALGGAGGGTVLTTVRSHVSVEEVDAIKALAVTSEHRIAVLEERRHADREELLQWRGDLSLKLQTMAENQAASATAAATAAAAAALASATAAGRRAAPAR